MGKQGVRQAARSTVREAISARQQQRMEQERRQAGWAVELLTALAERDQMIEVAEQAAAAAVRRLAGDGLAPAEIAALCGDRVDIKEINRLAKLEPKED